ncbi:MotA/TolQ/ExbB proton channel family protein [Microbulbifer aggregans]|uniref:MotA/TolQ/ExbB proton channel family protein n=1 Tax=Microbulbifer aggregans TaxID=1769779 RepID=UPI001CFF0402|nr:MotA/TolQ/ExbB proton channel family protein [Microbulbifer aggregans]
MSEFLRNVFLALSPEAVTEGFLWGMLAVFALALTARTLSRAMDFVEQAPGLLTSLGILGTFTGVIIGLFEFQIADIDNSIERLLDGLKTAFITSVCGIGLSIVLRALTRFVALPGKEEVKPVELADIQQSLESLQATVAQGQERQLEQNAELMNTFAEDCAKALVVEMEQVVANFNARVEAQFGENMTRFGENFAQFDEMVATLSREYKAHEERVEYWSEHCDTTVVGLVQVARDLQQVHSQLAEIPQFLSGMQEFGSEAREQIVALNAQLESYRDISTQVQTVMPQLGERIEQFVRGLDVVQQVLDSDMKQSLVSISKQSELLGAQIEAVSGAFEKMSSLDADFIQSLVQETITTHRNGMQELALQQARTHKEMTDALSHLIRKSIGDSEASIGKQYALVERRMEEEVDGVISAMGQALAAISGQFTRDYRQLIAQMQRVTEVGAATAERAEQREMA